MKLKCKKTVKRHFYRAEVDYSMVITKGKEYVALGISFSNKSRHVCLETNDGLPTLLDIRQFEVISNYVPSRWTVRYTRERDHLSFFPQTWVESESFWDRLLKRQEFGVFKLYRQERDLIFGEEPR
jgi:hypothetical protein